MNDNSLARLYWMRKKIPFKSSDLRYNPFQFPMRPFATICLCALLSSFLAPIELYANRAEARQAKAAEQAYLEKNAARPGVIATKSGLQYEILTRGESARIPSGKDRLILHYHGTMID